MHQFSNHPVHSHSKERGQGARCSRNRNRTDTACASCESSEALLKKRSRYWKEPMTLFHYKRTWIPISALMTKPILILVLLLLIPRLERTVQFKRIISRNQRSILPYLYFLYTVLYGVIVDTFRTLVANKLCLYVDTNASFLRQCLNRHQVLVLPRWCCAPFAASIVNLL
jgi:hypothetical protein